MKKSKDITVVDFISNLLAEDKEKYQIIQGLRKIVLKAFPAVRERIMYGGIMFSLEDDFGGLFVRQKHISFEFTEGVAMSDPNNFLEGKGKYRRHLKILQFSEINDKNVSYFVEQIE